MVRYNRSRGLLYNTKENRILMIYLGHSLFSNVLNDRKESQWAFGRINHTTGVTVLLYTKIVVPLYRSMRETLQIISDVYYVDLR